MHYGNVSRLASRHTKTFRYGLDLVLWSRILSGRRAAVPLDLPMPLLLDKGVKSFPPSLFLTDLSGDWHHWEEGFQAVYASLFLNLQTPNILSELRYAHPAPSFNGIYLWDSAFISQIWKHWDWETANEINMALIDQQLGDRLPHVVATFTESDLTQPPVMSWAQLANLEWYSDESQRSQIAETFYPQLRRYNRWLYNHRRLANDLYFWQHPYESGIDNSPRFSSRDEYEFLDTTCLASPDISAYVVLQNECLAKIAGILGHFEEQQQMLDHADRIRQQMNDYLWDEEEQNYFDRNIKTQEFVRSSTIASLIPLWAGVPDSARAKQLLTKILDPDQFNTTIPLPTVSLSDKDFANDMWRGPVWVNTAMAVIRGMRRYGFEEEAGEIAFRLVDGIYRTYVNTQKFHEFYDPQRFDIEQLERKKGNLFKYVTLGTKPVSDFVGWTGLVNTLVIEDLIGYARKGDQVWLAPTLPVATAGIRFTVRLPEIHATVSVERLSNQTFDCEYRDADLSHRTQLGTSQRWNLNDFSVTTREFDGPAAVEMDSENRNRTQ